MRAWPVPLAAVVAWVAVVACSSPYDPAADTAPAGASDASSEATAAEAAPADAGAVPDDAATDAGAPWKLYANGAVTPDAWTSIDLDAAWTGENAPPPRGIMAVTQLSVSDRLLVWADDGYFYTRVSGTWLPRLATATVFPALKGRDFRGVYHQPNFPTANVEELTVVDNPTAIQFTYSLQGVVTLQGTPLTMADEAGPYGAPKASKKCRWVTRQWRPNTVGPSRLTEYSGYDGDDNVYFYDGTPQPAGKWPFAAAPPFAGKSGVPPRERIMSGWHDDALDITYLVVR